MLRRRPLNENCDFLFYFYFSFLFAKYSHGRQTQKIISLEKGIKKLSNSVFMGYIISMSRKFKN